MADGDNVDLEGIGQLLERGFRRAGTHSRLWIGGWLPAILVVTTIAAISQAPTTAYAILGVVVGVAVFANDGSRTRGGSCSEVDRHGPRQRNSGAHGG